MAADRPGVVQLLREGDLKLGSIRFFVIDECDKVLDKSGEAHLGSRPHIVSHVVLGTHTSSLQLWQQQL